MKYLIYTLALMSAFFVSGAEPDMSDLKQPSIKSKYCTTIFSNGMTGKSCGDVQQNLDFEACLTISFTPFQIAERSFYDMECRRSASTIRFLYTSPRYPDKATGVGTELPYSSTYDTQSTSSCPNPDFPAYILLVPDGSGKSMCAKELEPEPDPDAKCDEFGNNSMLPPKDDVGTPGQTACYTNPTTGKSCQYSQGHDNFTATGKDCDGDENDYGDKPTPQPPPDGNDDNCYDYGSLGGVLICDVDPNQGCNALLINGQTQYQCPPGCGSMDGVYFCAYDDLDGDGKADDKNGNGVPDKDETCLNGRCTPNPDSNETPNPDAPDMTQTNNKLDGIKGELGFIGGKINISNKKLDGINSSIQGLKGEQKASTNLLGNISNSNNRIATNTGFTADSTGKLLESFNEFKEGIGETDIESNFNPDASVSFYESSYENGFEGVWEEKSTAFKQTETFLFLEQFKFNAGGSAPDTQMCFNLGGSMDFGCAELPTPSPQLLAIIKVFILITAAFLCRALIFGG